MSSKMLIILELVLLATLVALVTAVSIWPPI